MKLFIFVLCSLASIHGFDIFYRYFDRYVSITYSKSAIEEQLASIKLTINHGLYCGAYHIDAKICRDDINICCEDEIVDNVNGFSRGDTIDTRFDMGCANFTICTIDENLSIKLTGRNGDGFCPANLEIRTYSGSRWKTSFSSGNSKIDETPKTALAFIGELKSYKL